MSHRAHLSALVPHAPAPGFARAGIDADYAPDLAWEPVHLDLDLRPDAEARAMSGTMLLTALCHDPRTRVLRLDAVDLRIDSVEGVDGGAVDWTSDGASLRIVWSDAATRGEQRVVRVTWYSERPIAGLVGPTPDWNASAGPFLATDHETQRARYWLPCIDHPSVRPRLDVAVTVPAGHTALAAGAFVDETDHPDGSRTVRWRLSEGCPSYLTCVATGAFAEADGGVHTTADGRTVPIAFFAPHPFTEADLQRSFGRTREMLDWMTAFLDSTFPYPKYYQFSVPGIGGAMENISLVSWDDAWMVDERAHAEFGWLVDLINLHEMAHTWFGDVVVCRDYAHAWLKESWATYMESVWLEETVGTDAMHLLLADERRAYFSEADGSYIRPIATRFFDSPWDLYDRHLYPGGAIRLHLLRHELGDDAFWRGVRAYLARYRGRVVETDDFRRELEAASGRSLARFFDDWFRSPGYPRLKAKWTYDADACEGVVEVSREAWAQDKGVPRFGLPLTVEVLDAAGTWHRETVRFDRETASVRFALPKAPAQVVVDPDSVLPAKIKLELGAELLHTAVAECPRVRGRLDAATALADKARRTGLDAIAAAYRGESHWQVRAHFARCLGGAATDHAAELLVDLLAHETDPRAMQGLLEACGKHRHARLADAVAAWLDGGPRPYRASAAALLALGNQRDARFEARLLAASTDDGWWGWIARGAVQGLGALRTEAATARLEALAIATTTKRSVRVQAAENLGKAGRWQARAVRERLVLVLGDLTRDADPGVRKSAASGLVHLGEPAGAGAIGRLARVGLPMQETPRFEKKAATLRTADASGRVGALEKTVEKLTADLAKLRARLDSKDKADR